MVVQQRTEVTPQPQMLPVAPVREHGAALGLVEPVLESNKAVLDVPTPGQGCHRGRQLGQMGDGTVSSPPEPIYTRRTWA